MVFRRAAMQSLWPRRRVWLARDAFRSEVAEAIQHLCIVQIQIPMYRRVRPVCFIESLLGGIMRIFFVAGKALLALSFCAFALIATNANANFFAGLFYAKVKVKTESEIVAGLDEPTRSLIASLPESARKEAVEFARQALPELDKSVISYIDRIDLLIENRLNQLVCTGQAVGQGVAEELKGVILNEKPKPIAALALEFDDREKNFRYTSARSIAISYEDFLQQAGIAACRLVDTAGTQRINTLRVQSRDKWRMWLAIEETCSDPHDCLLKQHALVSATVKAADPRDAEATSASKLLGEVVLLQKSTRWFSTDVKNWVAFEKELLKLRDIDRSVSAAAALRVSVAQRYLSDAESLVLDGEKAILSARGRLSQSSSSENDAAKAEAVKARANEVAAVEQAKLAGIGDASNLAKAMDLEHRVAKIEAESKAIVSAADGNNANLSKAAADAAARAQERQAEIERRRAIRQAIDDVRHR